MYQPPEEFIHLLSLEHLTPVATAYFVDWSASRTLPIVDDVPLLPITTSLLFKREQFSLAIPATPYFWIDLPTRQPDNPGVNPYLSVFKVGSVWEVKQWEMSIVPQRQRSARNSFGFNAHDYCVELPKAYVDVAFAVEDDATAGSYINYRYAAAMGSVKQKMYRVLKRTQPKPPSLEEYIRRWEEFETHGDIRHEPPSTDTLEVYYLFDEMPKVVQHVNAPSEKEGWTEYVQATPFLDAKTAERAVGLRGEYSLRQSFTGRRR